MTLPEYLAQVAARFKAAGGTGPYRVDVVRHGVPWWFWIDDTGGFVPPPQTVFQPTVHN